MLGITDLSTYLLGTIAIILLPGPNSLFVLSVSAQRGARAGYAAAGGVFVGDTVLMLLASVGAASMLQAWPAFFVAIKVVGAAYLAWVGMQLLMGALRRWWGVRTPAGARPHELHRPFRRALVISLLNPKAILFFLSFFIQFVDPAYPWPGLTFVGLGAIAQACSLLYLSVLILAGARLAAAFAAHRRAASAATSGVGVLFLGFGAKLATASVG